MTTLVDPTVMQSPVSHGRTTSGAPSGVESVVLLRNVSWAGYQTLLREVGDSAVRMTFDNGLLEIAVPGKRHEELKALVEQLVGIFLSRRRLVYAPLGSTTWAREDLVRGLEADLCYFFGQAAIELRGKRKLDLAVDPPPGLAIEVEVTNSAIDKMAIYAGIGVAELWRVGVDGSVRPHRLGDDGRYAPVATSMLVPELPPAVLEEHLKLLDSLGHAEVVWRFEDRIVELLPPKQ